jgi:tetratricopeptide (TPR) repeat protein
VDRRQSYEECNNLGVAQMMLERYQDAVESFRCALAIRPGDLGASFNLAESLKLSGDEAAAAEQFRQLLALARKQSGDRTSDSIRREAQVLAHLAGNEPALAEEARALTQQVLAAVPVSQINLYAAAVVHALLGDQDQAAAHVRTLLDRRMTPDWFRFPWFDGVREHPDLRQRLTYLPPSSACE